MIDDPSRLWRAASAAARRASSVHTFGPWPDLDGRLRLAAGRQLARGAARSEPAAGGHPRAARGGERLCRRCARADGRAAEPARARDARPSQGGRQRASAGRRAFRLLLALPPGRPASDLLPNSRARGARRRCCIDGDARAEGKAFFQLAARRPFARPYEVRLERRRPRLGDPHHSPCATSRAAEDLADRVANATGDIVWTPRLPRLSLCRAGRKPSSVPRHAASARRTPQRDDVEVFVEADPAWFISLEATRLGRSGADRRARPRRLGDACRRSRRADGAAAADRAAPAGPLL